MGDISSGGCAKYPILIISTILHVILHSLFPAIASLLAIKLLQNGELRQIIKFPTGLTHWSHLLRKCIAIWHPQFGARTSYSWISSSRAERSNFLDSDFPNRHTIIITINTRVGSILSY